MAARTPAFAEKYAAYAVAFEPPSMTAPFASGGSSVTPSITITRTFMPLLPPRQRQLWSSMKTFCFLLGWGQSRTVLMVPCDSDRLPLGAKDEHEDYARVVRAVVEFV